ncbi:MAG: DUF523 domain-containing protein [Myxococcota bacterium]|nr:DUF523 domain-containing protein [Myxococcota bacterium]
MKLVCSACLLGEACRYDGASKAHARVLEHVQSWLAKGGEVVSLCPEELGELGTPRPACELSGGDGAAFWNGSAHIRQRDTRENRSHPYARGAEEALKLAEGATRAVLKARSPSCGCGETWIDGTLQKGDGVFAARMRALGVPLSTEEDL